MNYNSQAILVPHFFLIFLYTLVFHCLKSCTTLNYLSCLQGCKLVERLFISFTVALLVICGRLQLPSYWYCFVCFFEVVEPGILTIKLKELKEAYAAYHQDKATHTKSQKAYPETHAKQYFHYCFWCGSSYLQKRATHWEIDIEFKVIIINQRNSPLELHNSITQS